MEGVYPTREASLRLSGKPAAPWDRPMAPSRPHTALPVNQMLDSWALHGTRSFLAPPIDPV
jgi:hypothetical protein